MSTNRGITQTLREMLMNHHALFIALCLTLCGCATTPIPASTAKQVPDSRLLAFKAQPSGQFGTLVVTRDEGLLGSACFYAVSVNGVTAARLDVGEKATLFVEPGELVLRAGRDPQGKGVCSGDKDNWTQRETLLRANETKYFRLSLDANGKPDIQRGEK